MKKYSNLALCQRNIVKAVCSNSPGHPQRLLVLSVFMKNYIIDKLKNKFKCCNVCTAASVSSCKFLNVSNSGDGGRCFLCVPEYRSFRQVYMFMQLCNYKNAVIQ